MRPGLFTQPNQFHSLPLPEINIVELGRERDKGRGLLFPFALPLQKTSLCVLSLLLLVACPHALPNRSGYHK